MQLDVRLAKLHGTFVILGIDFPAYFTLLMIGFLVGIYAAWRHAPREGIEPNRILDLGMLLVIAGVMGGRFAHVLFDGQLMDYVYLCTDPLRATGRLLPGAADGVRCVEDTQCVAAQLGQLCNLDSGTCHSERDCLRAFKFWYGGLTYYGGFLLAIPTGIWFLKRHGIPPWRVGDLAAFGVPLGIGFGRMGCFFAGCCFGEVCDSDFGVSFPTGSPAWRTHSDAGWVTAADVSLPVHATQLYTAIAMWLLAAFCYWYYRRVRRFDGEAFWVFGILYAIARFVIEMFRADQRGEYFGLSTSQGIGVLLTVTSLVMLIRLHRAAVRNPEARVPGRWSKAPDTQ